MKKETFLAILLWGIVAYSVAVLSYFTLKVIFKHDSSLISAFGSILSACATFFAAYVATKLYNNWKDEKRYDLNKDLAIKALSTLLDFSKSYCYYLDELGLESEKRDSKRFDINHLYNLKNQFYDEYGIYISVNSEKSSRGYEIPCKNALDECWESADSYFYEPNPINQTTDSNLRDKLNDKTITDTIETLLEAIKVK